MATHRTRGVNTFAPRVLIGDYEPLMELARGGVATAMVARKVGAAGFERLVVIKRVHRNLLGNTEFYNMFRDEARLASSVRHPNVASVIDVIDVSPPNPELCLVMDYFEALSLSTLLRDAEARRPSPRVVARIVCDALAGLDAAHEATDLRHEPLGIVHRDFTPQNIICDTDGVTRVIDFGIAKATTRLTHTKSGIVKGKLAYMAPEQIEAQSLDRRTDVFAAGVVLHEALTGRPLFAGGDDFAVMRRILRETAPPPSAFAAEISTALDAVVARALERSPSDRFPTARALQAALEAAVAPASQREVSVWVQSVGGSVLSERRATLLAMLRGASEAPGGATARGDAAPGLERVEAGGQRDLVPAGVGESGRWRWGVAIMATAAVALALAHVLAR